MLPPVLIYLARHRPDRVRHDLPYLWNDMLHHIDMSVPVLLVNVPLELLERDLVPILKLAVVLRMLLDSVIGQMHVFGLQVVQRELLARGPDIPALLEKEGSQGPVERGQNCEDSDVKLPLLIEQGVLNVLLDDIGPGGRSFPHDRLDFLETADHLDAVPTVRALSGLDDPGIAFKLIININ